MIAHEVADYVELNGHEYAARLIREGEAEDGIRVLYAKGEYDLAMWCDSKLGEGVFA